MTDDGRSTPAEGSEDDDELICDFAHDVCTPLANVKLAGDLLISGGEQLSAETLDDLGQTLSVESERLRWLVDVLLTWHRFETGGRTLRHDWHMVEELVGSAVERVAQMRDADEFDRCVRVNIEPDMAMVRCDGGLMERALTALLDVAFDTTSDDMIVEIDVDDERVRFQLAISLRSEQGDSEACSEKGEKRGSTPGAALAVAVARRIIAMHGSELAQRARRSSSEAFFAFELSPGDHTPPRLSVEARQASMEVNEGNH